MNLNIWKFLQRFSIPVFTLSTKSNPNSYGFRNKLISDRRNRVMRMGVGGLIERAIRADQWADECWTHSVRLPEAAVPSIWITPSDPVSGAGTHSHSNSPSLSLSQSRLQRSESATAQRKKKNGGAAVLHHPGSSGLSTERLTTEHHALTRNTFRFTTSAFWQSAG